MAASAAYVHRCPRASVELARFAGALGCSDACGDALNSVGNACGGFVLRSLEIGRAHV